MDISELDWEKPIAPQLREYEFFTRLPMIGDDLPTQEQSDLFCAAINELVSSGEYTEVQKEQFGIAGPYAWKAKT